MRFSIMVIDDNHKEEPFGVARGEFSGNDPVPELRNYIWDVFIRATERLSKKKETLNEEDDKK